MAIYLQIFSQQFLRRLQSINRGFPSVSRLVFVAYLLINVLADSNALAETTARTVSDVLQAGLENVGQDFHKRMFDRAQARAAQGDSTGKLEATLYRSTLEEYRRLLDTLEARALSGDTHAQTIVGLQAMSSWKVNETLPRYQIGELLAWLRRAAEQGHPEAQYELARYLIGREGARGIARLLPTVTPNLVNFRAGLTWLKLAADQGLPLAQYEFALLSQRIDEVRNLERANAYMRKAANAGLPNAIAELGVMADRGVGQSKNVEEALRLHVMAAELGDRRGMFNAGISYYLGTSGTIDYSKAHEWLGKSRDAGVAQSLAYLGEMHATGRGVQRNLGLASDLLKESIRRLGDPIGHAVLAQILAVELKGATDLSAVYYHASMAILLNQQYRQVLTKVLDGIDEKTAQKVAPLVVPQNAKRLFSDI